MNKWKKIVIWQTYHYNEWDVQLRAPNSTGIPTATHTGGCSAHNRSRPWFPALLYNFRWGRKRRRHKGGLLRDFICAARSTLPASRFGSWTTVSTLFLWQRKTVLIIISSLYPIPVFQKYDNHLSIFSCNNPNPTIIAKSFNTVFETTLLTL